MNRSDIHGFYTSAAWRKLRKNLISERGCKCSRCGKLITESVKLIGHHKIELNTDNVNNPLIALNPDNIELVCFECHELEKKMRGESVIEFDEEGFPYGPP